MHFFFYKALDFVYLLGHQKGAMTHVDVINTIRYKAIDFYLFVALSLNCNSYKYLSHFVVIVKATN